MTSFAAVARLTKSLAAASALSFCTFALADATPESTQSAPSPAASSQTLASDSRGVFYEPAPVAPKTETQKKAAEALKARYPNVEMASLGGGENTQQGPHARALIAFGPAGFLAGRFKTEVVCSEVILDRAQSQRPVTAMYFLSPKTHGAVLVVDTPVSDAACVPKGDSRRTGQGQKDFRDFMSEHDAYSKNVFRSLFGT